MIPVEYFWGVLILMFGIIGATRGLSKELGATTVLVLSLFVLKFVWLRFNAAIVGLAGQRFSDEVLRGLYFGVIIIFVAIISYEGVVLSFPVRSQKGLGKGIFGFLGGLLNGYLVVGTVWDVFAHANYFQPLLKIVNTAALTPLHQQAIKMLPITFVNEYLLLLFGMILLLAIVFK